MDVQYENIDSTQIQIENVQIFQSNANVRPYTQALLDSSAERLRHGAVRRLSSHQCVPFLSTF